MRTELVKLHVPKWTEGVKRRLNERLYGELRTDFHIRVIDRCHHCSRRKNDFTLGWQLGRRRRWRGEGIGIGSGKQLCRLERADKEPTNCSQSERARSATTGRSACNRYKRVVDDDRWNDVRIWSPFSSCRHQTALSLPLDTRARIDATRLTAATQGW